MTWHSKHRHSEDGMTLIELVIAVTIMVGIMSAATVAFTGALRDTKNTQTAFADAHDAQLVETYFPVDTQSAQTVDISSGAISGCSSVVTSPAVLEKTLVHMTLVESSTTYHVSYQIVRPDPVRTERVLYRVACTTGGTPTKLVVAHGLKDPATGSWAATSMLKCSTRISMTLVEDSGYSYFVSGNARPTATATTASACPVGTTTTTTSSTTSTTVVPVTPQILEVDQLDTGTPNGKIDQLFVTLSKAPTGTCTQPGAWSFVSGPSGATTVSSVTVSGLTMTVNITEGGGTADTLASAFRVAFAPQGTCNIDAKSSVDPVDKAGPVLIGMTPTNGNHQAAQNDTLNLQFSEALSSPPTSTNLTISSVSGVVKLSVPGISNGTMNFGSGYIAANQDYSATFTSSAVTVPGSPTNSITITLSACGGPNCNKLGTGSGTFGFTPAATLVDSSGNAAPSVAYTGGPIF